MVKYFRGVRMIRLLFWDVPTYLDWLNDNYWWPVILCVLIVAVAFYFIFIYKPKPKDLIVSDEEVDTIIQLFGGRENIVSVSKEGARFTFTLQKVESCNLEGIKKLGATGVFISGSNVKLIFPFNADRIVDIIK